MGIVNQSIRQQAQCYLEAAELLWRLQEVSVNQGSNASKCCSELSRSRRESVHTEPGKWENKQSWKVHLEHFIGFIKDKDLHCSVGQHALALPVLELAVSPYNDLLIDHCTPAKPEGFPDLFQLRLPADPIMTGECPLKYSRLKPANQGLVALHVHGKFALSSSSA